MKKVVSFIIVLAMLIGLTLPVSASLEDFRVWYNAPPLFHLEWYDAMVEDVQNKPSSVPANYTYFMFVTLNDYSYKLLWSPTAVLTNGQTIYITSGSNIVSTFTFTGARYDSSQDCFVMDEDSKIGFHTKVNDYGTATFPNWATLASRTGYGMNYNETSVRTYPAYGYVKLLHAYTMRARYGSNIGYTEYSWNNLHIAANLIFEVDWDTDGYTAVSMLQDAMRRLVLPTDITALEELIQTAKAINNTGYSAVSWNALQVQISASESLLESNDYMRVQIIAAIENLQAALDGLALSDIESVKYNDDDQRISYTGTWSYYRGNEFYNGDEHFSNQTGAYAEFTFDGTSINYIAATSNNLGKCDIYIDGVLEQSGVDAYSPTLEPQKSLFYKDGLDNGQHTIKIVVTGERNADAADCFVTVDAFEVNGDGSVTAEIMNVTYNDNDTEIRYNGLWTYYSDPAFYGGDEHFSNQQGAYAELDFYGTSISYIAATSNNLGMCDIYIDGILEQSDVDAYSPALEPQQVLFYKDGLTAGWHTIKIVVTGNRNQSATDGFVTVDAFEVN